MRSFTPWNNNGCFTDVASEGEYCIDLSVRQEPDPLQIHCNYYFKCIFLACNVIHWHVGMKTFKTQYIYAACIFSKPFFSD